MSKRIFIAGHMGMVGSALLRQLGQDDNNEIITRDLADLDLTNQQQVAEFFRQMDSGIRRNDDGSVTPDSIRGPFDEITPGTGSGQPRPSDTSVTPGLTRGPFDEIYLAAAKVGGIHANDTYPAEFIYENLAMQCNVIHQAWRSGVKKLLFLGSSCIYPRDAAQPMQESELLGGPLEPTNEPYAIAKIAGIKLCESYNRQYGTDYRSVMPTNLYGPGDNYHPENSHVIPALLRRFHEAKLSNADSTTIWGTGKPQREFLHVDDMARACIHIMDLPFERYQEVANPRLSHINVGSGVDCSIAELAALIGEVTGFEGTILYDTNKPDGPPRKLLDSSRLKDLGWKPEYTLKEGLTNTYRWFVENHETASRQDSKNNE